MIQFLAMKAYVCNFAKELKRNEKRMLMVEYSKINEVPQEIRDLINRKVLFEQSPIKHLYINCGITNKKEMIDNFLHILYLYVNYEPEK